jgi:UDP-N-acetylmuramoyl-tripeptide--D-alanyl-D-alanine ligase
VQLTLQGEHNVMNALAAAATGVELGIPAAAIAAALQQATPAAMRQEMVTTATGVLVVNDAYNANPDSMRAALALLTRLSPAYPHIAVLGDMAELGAQEHSHHHAIGAFAAASGIEALITVGERARAIAQGAREEGMPADKVVACPDVATALDALAPHLARKPIVLVKASRCMGLERLVEGIGALC